MIRRVQIEKLAPTGEGVSRSEEGVGFIRGALPGEEVEAEVEEVRKRFWRGRVSRVIAPSVHRVYGAHAESCGGCDWGYFDLAAARDVKRELFLETMERIGKLPRRMFGDVAVAASLPGYRLRSRLHVARAPGSVRIGWFGRRSHVVEPASDCKMLSASTRGVLPVLSDAILSSGAPVDEISMLEDLDGSRRAIRLTVAGDGSKGSESLADALAATFEGVRIQRSDGAVVREAGDPRVALTVARREFRVPVDAFFQSNRYLVEPLVEDVTAAARTGAAGTSLDAYAGVGLFAAALLDAGHSVVSVEESAPSLDAARAACRQWRVEDRWAIVRATMRAYLEVSSPPFAVTVADPPRAGLGPAVARRLARRTSSVFVYVSCEPATLARDLAVLVEEGLRIERARLYDLFAFTHRVEGAVVLSRSRAS